MKTKLAKTSEHQKAKVGKSITNALSKWNRSVYRTITH